MSKLSEEEFKFLWRSYHPELDLEYVGKYDAKSKCGSLIIEFKSIEKDWKKIITQALLTAAKEGKKFKIIGAVSQDFPEGKFIDTFDCKISMRSIKAFNAVPSAWNSVEWQIAHKSLEPLYKERKCPTKEEIIMIESAYQFNNSFTKKEKEIACLGFGSKFGDGKKLQETSWAVPENLDQLNAYFTPEPLRIKVKEIVNKNWPNLKTVWDPYGGDGALVKQFNCEVIISDIQPQGSNIIELDFLKDIIPSDIKNKFGPDFAIVTNPSFGKKHVHNLINFCRNNKIKLATFGACSDFPYEPLPGIDGFNSVRGIDWKNILVQYGFRKNEIIPFIMFDFEKESIDSIKDFEFYNPQAIYKVRTGQLMFSGSVKVSEDLFRRASHIKPELGAKIITQELYDWIIANVQPSKKAAHKLHPPKKNV